MSGDSDIGPDIGVWHFQNVQIG